LAIRSLRRAAVRISDDADALDVTASWSFLGVSIAPWQLRSEIESLLGLVTAVRPARLLEIGTANGGSLFLLARAAADDAHLLSVDLPQGQFGGGYPRWRALLYRSFARRGQIIDLLRGDSHSEEMRSWVVNVLGGKPLDFLFIDGDHSYAGVAKDFEMYAPLVKPGGLIAFHDIVPQTKAPRGREGAGGAEFCTGDVPDFWAELRERYTTTEFVENWDQGSFGIGVIRVPVG
jgi:predicted O-methyltransferase YrrM